MILLIFLAVILDNFYYDINMEKKFYDFHVKLSSINSWSKEAKGSQSALSKEKGWQKAKEREEESRSGSGGIRDEFSAEGAQPSALTTARGGEGSHSNNS